MTIPWAVVCIGIILSWYKGVQCTICSNAAESENTAVIRMCQSGSVITQRVVIDTYDTGGPDVYSCACTARPLKVSSDTVSFTRVNTVEQKSNCGSSLNVTFSSKSSINFECKLPDQSYRQGSTTFDLTLSRTTKNKPWQYGYCILLTTVGFNWNVSCLPPVKITTDKPLSTTSPLPSTTTPKTTSRATTTEYTSSVPVTQTSTPGKPESSTERVCSPQTIEVSSTATVVIPIVVVVLIAAVTTVANVIIYRRRLTIEKEPKKTDHVLKPSSSVVYDGIDVARIEPPNTYADIDAGRMYSNTAAGVKTGQVYENTMVSNTDS